MSKNPLINALAALGYIILVASIMTYGSKLSSPPNQAVIAPIAVLSLLTLSAAVMGYIFGYMPAQLYFEDKKKKAVDLFLRTVGMFAVITALLIGLAFSGLF